jgi:cytidylate kinase
VPAADAIVIDTSNLDASTVFAQVMAIVNQYQHTGALAKQATSR